jgi:hypothetical protein
LKGFSPTESLPFDAVEWEKRTALIGNEGCDDLPAGGRRGAEELVADDHGIVTSNIFTANLERESAKDRCGN